MSYLASCLLLLVASTDAGRIVYSSDVDGDLDLYVADADGAGERRVADLPGDESWPRWSPDGHWLLFHWERDGRSDLAMIPAAGGEPSLITEDGVSYEGAWSPDGERVVYRSSRDGDDELYVQPLDGTSSAVRITHQPGSDWGPDWSPDGEWIVFAAASAEREAIARVRPGGGDVEILGDMPGEESNPRWSPDGRSIVFCAHPGGPSSELHVMSGDGEGARRLTFSSYEQRHAANFHPAWSPDGSHIAFISRRDGDNELYVIGADGEGLRRLTRRASMEARPDWTATDGVEEGSVRVNRDAGGPRRPRRR